MISKELKENFFICPNCTSKDQNMYQAWVKFLAELPLIHGEWDFSGFLWYMGKCPNCQRTFPSAFMAGDPNDVFSSIPFVLEWVVMESLELKHSKLGLRGQKIPPIRQGYSEGWKRSGFPFEILAWVGLAVASGVIGNMAYEIIRKAVLDARKDILQKRKTLLNKRKIKKISKEELQYCGPLFHDWDAISDEELERYVRLIYEYAKQRLKNVKL